MTISSGSYPTSYKIDQNPSITLSATDPSRYVGLYIIHMQDIGSGSSSNVTGNPFTISIGTKSQYNTGGTYQNGDNSMDALSFGAIFALSLVFSLVLSYAIRRMRQRAIIERMFALQGIPTPSKYDPKFMPVLHSAILDLPSDLYVGKSVKNALKRNRRGDDGSTMDLLRNGIVGFLNLLAPPPPPLHPQPISSSSSPHSPRPQSTTSRSTSSNSLAANAALGVKTILEKLVRTNSSSNVRNSTTAADASNYAKVSNSPGTSQVSKAGGVLPIENNEKGFEHVELHPISKQQILKSNSFVEDEMDSDQDQGKLMVKIV